VVVSGAYDDDGTVRVWDLNSGKQRGEPLLHEGQVLSVAFGMLDGQPVVVSGGFVGTVRVWDLASGARLAEPMRGSEMGVLSVAVGTLDGLPVTFSGGQDGFVRAWDAAGAAVSSVYVGSRVRSLAIAGPRMVAVAGDRGLLLLQFEMTQPGSPLSTGSWRRRPCAPEG
jgi:WD40 repeat protein